VFAGAQQARPSSTTTRLFSSVTPNIQHIGKAEMRQILEECQSSSSSGDEDRNHFCVIDVRTFEEVTRTGPLSDVVHTLPIQTVVERQVFALDGDDFEEIAGFAKPSTDQTLVFSCAAGVRSVYACHFAAQAGYSNLINYTGGSNEWFYS
jgi:rhodanese-related sulfurtransferase